MAAKKTKKPARRIEEKPDPLELRIGAALKRARRSLVPEMSQGAVGDVIGCTGQQIQKYEAGTDRIKLSTFVGICHATATDPVEVLREIVEGPGK